MKNRDYKEFSSGEYYHIFNRGVGKQNIFLDDEDYFQFLKRLKLVLNISAPTRAPLVTQNTQGAPLSGLRITPFPKESFEIICYCLMPNHFHFLIKQKEDTPISKLVSKICTSYSMYFNKKYKRVGTLFQDRFKSVLVSSDEYLLWLSAYIHQNPIGAGLTSDLTAYPWSSYLDYIGSRQGVLCNKDIIIGQFKTVLEYREFVKTSFEIIKDRKELDSLLLD